MISNNIVIIAVLSILVIAISITVHEFMHGFVSNALGDDTAKQSGQANIKPNKTYRPIYDSIIADSIAIKPFASFWCSKTSTF